ncbi:hypothetical protein BK010_09795 [Tenericutes bacterium MO-XQ]|nr:hypothetical protein BK010_09795 [Tenericutes bacterium MO-XQ]
MLDIALYILLGILGLLVLIWIIGFVSRVLFNNQFKKETKVLLDLVSHEENLDLDKIEKLPKPVKKWLRLHNIKHQQPIDKAYMTQDIKMRLGQDKPWMKATAKQYVTTKEPGFIWKVLVKMMPGVHISGRDKYIYGQGEMLIKVMSFLKVVDSKGLEIDQGTLIRYLAEICWVPTAALNDYITWEDIDDHHAKAIMSYKDITAEGIFEFNDEGHMISFEALRYGEFDGIYQLKPWHIDMNGIKDFSGFKLPTEGKVIWKLEDGDYHWYQFIVTNVVFNERV